MYSDSRSITNESDKPLNVWIEPNAFDVDIPPGETYEFTSTSEIEGKFEVEKTEDGLTVWAWAGSDLLIKNGEEIIIKINLRFPIIRRKFKNWWQFWK